MKKNLLIVVFVALLTSGLFYFSNIQNENNIEQPVVDEIPTRNNPLTIILSPHFDDGVWSLGGLMAKNKNESKNELLVATFFTQRPAETAYTHWDKISGFSDSNEAISARTKENEKALAPFQAIIKNYDYLDFQYRIKKENKKIKEKISKDIDALIKEYQDRELFIYGPATFGLEITHPDHQIVHDSFMDVWRKNKIKNVQFLIYEDFPYAKRFAISRKESLNNYLEKTENIKLEENPIELDKTELEEKITGIDTYKSQIKSFGSLGDNIRTSAQKFYTERCKGFRSMIYTCEMTYKPFQKLVILP